MINSLFPFYIHFYRDVNLILNRIKDGASKDLVKKIRSEKNKDERKILKSKLPAVCFSGTFSRRSDNALIKHSGIICLDFDEYKSNKLNTFSLYLFLQVVMD